MTKEDRRQLDRAQATLRHAAVHLRVLGRLHQDFETLAFEVETLCQDLAETQQSLEEEAISEPW